MLALGFLLSRRVACERTYSIEQFTYFSEGCRRRVGPYFEIAASSSARVRGLVMVNDLGFSQFLRGWRGCVL